MAAHVLTLLTKWPRPIFFENVFSPVKMTIQVTLLHGMATAK